MPLRSQHTDRKISSSTSREQQHHPRHGSNPNDVDGRGIRIPSVDPPLIYSAPTVDTLGDDSLTMMATTATATNGMPTRLMRGNKTSDGTHRKDDNSNDANGDEHDTYPPNAYLALASPQRIQPPPPPPPPRLLSPPPPATTTTTGFGSSQKEVSLAKEKSQIQTMTKSSTDETVYYSSSMWNESSVMASEDTQQTKDASTSTTAAPPETLDSTMTTVTPPAATSSSSPPPEFQKVQQSMSVTVRKIPIEERSAFALQPAPTMDELFQQASNIATTTATNGTTVVSTITEKNASLTATTRTPKVTATQMKRISPSPRHLYWIQKLQSMKYVRQLSFSPSVGRASDILYSTSFSFSNDYSHHGNDNRANRRDRMVGRYQSIIDPVQATLLLQGNTGSNSNNDEHEKKAGLPLPPTPPLISNKRHRLPMRADVGFPNPTAQEIQQKQREIQQETEWEEASPRLIVLVTSDDLGTAAVDTSMNMNTNISTITEESLVSAILNVMPYAGPELIAAKWQNQKHQQQYFHSQRQQQPPRESMKNKLTQSTPSLNPHLQQLQSLRYSMLAPPLDATYSRSMNPKTLGWKPRLYHDRPPEMQYTLISPIQLDFGKGRPNEPLVCSISLYHLHKVVDNNIDYETDDENFNNTLTPLNGKVTEHFTFPAGNWQGKIRPDDIGVQALDSSESIEQWLRRKHKGLFALDPHLLNAEDLHIVLKVYKVTHLDLAAAYLTKYQKDDKDGHDEPISTSHTSPSDRKGWKKRLKKQFQKKMTPEAFLQRASYRASSVYENFGTQFLSPLCFGVTQLYQQQSMDSSEYVWPKGQVHSNMILHAYPTKPESHDVFVQRLDSLIRPSPVGRRSSSNSSNNSSGRNADVGVNPTVTKIDGTPLQKRKGLSRFISPKKGKREMRNGISTTMSSASSIATISESQKKSVTIEPTPTMPAKVLFFVSNLQGDFLNAMLSIPAELQDLPSRKKNDTIGSSSKLLVDVSGMCGIMMEAKESQKQKSDNITMSKRSHLVRLPATPKGYRSASNFQEVWFLPPVCSKQPTIDKLPSYNSLLNVLYLYPLSLKQSGGPTNGGVYRKSSKEKNIRYSIRISLIESVTDKQATGVVELQTIVIPSFHNPAPWSGSSLLESIYTTIPADQSLDALKGGGIAMQDELKMQLPQILNGNHFLRFTLCVVDLADDLDDGASSEFVNSAEEMTTSLSMHQIAESSIPLSSYAVRDPASGTKVTTIIPNGIHRIKLAEFQLQVETRLLSSIHVSDPSLATALREFPTTSGEGLSFSSGDSELGFVTKAKPKVMYSTLFASADSSSILVHFPVLLMMHLANLVKTSTGSNAVEEQFVFDCMDSLLKICERAKDGLSNSDSLLQRRMQAFIKATMDAYDEAYLHSNEVEDDNDKNDDDSDTYPSNGAESSEGVPIEEQEFDGGAIRRKKKDVFRSDLDMRISRTFSAMDSPSVSFLRTAYGASKTDRMRLEAELNTSAPKFTHLVDDDETVATFATSYTAAETRMAEAREAFERAKMPRKDRVDLKNLKTAGIGSSESSTDFSYKSFAETGLAKRVRSAAQIMLAPCVPPNFFDANQQTNQWQDEKSMLNERVHSSKEVKSKICHEEFTESSIARTGTDVEEKHENQPSTMTAIIPQLAQGAATFRTPHFCNIFTFSVQFEAFNPHAFVPVQKTEYVYESLFLLWFRSISDFAASQGFSRSSLSILTMSLRRDTPEDNVLLRFYDSMDILLPICLKSITLRFAQVYKNQTSPGKRVIMDQKHIVIFESFFETIPLLLLREAISDNEENKNNNLENVLAKSDQLIDFLVALLAIFHPAHTSVLTSKFFESLRCAETEGYGDSRVKCDHQWTESNLHRVKCSRQLRLRAVEKLAVLPNFVAINYPMRFSDYPLNSRSKMPSWTNQQMKTEVLRAPRAGDFMKQNENVFPRSGWLADLLTKEALLISALSCEAVVIEAMAHVKENERDSLALMKPALQKRASAALTREDLMMFQSIAIHGIICVHELLLRRHAMDRRYQTESTRERVASLFAVPILEQSLASVRWLARMESTHRIRSLWLLCFAYILQEAPESLIRDLLHSYSNSKEIQIHRFVRLLRLSSSTFQSFIDQERYCMFPSEIDLGISPWLLQESFNTICATTILVVEECASPNSASRTDQKKLIEGILDLLLHILTTPQSTVTHLRALGGAIQALEGFGISMFLDTTGQSLQHWIRVITGLLNSVALSVRSIAVDFVVSLLGSSFDLYGSIDELAIIFATVLPEVAAREIGLCSVSGHINSFDDVERAIWPLRRSFADLEDSNPLDDDRVDPQLAPVISVFCRACQAILDGVLVEMRLEGKHCDVVGSKIALNSLDMYTFDADEESLFEASSFFVPESAPLQRIRWLTTLQELHKAKEQWLEAAESLILCSMTIADSILHIQDVWTPSQFTLWSDLKRSLWLSTVGEDLGIPERGNQQVMMFANRFVESNVLHHLLGSYTDSRQTTMLNVPDLCKMLTVITKNAIKLYGREGDTESLAYSRLESLLKVLLEVLEEHGSRRLGNAHRKTQFSILDRRRQAEEEASLRRVIANISSYMTDLAERMLLLGDKRESTTTKDSTALKTKQHYFIRIILSGKKPKRFTESTTLPAFLEWDAPCICRVSGQMAARALHNAGNVSDRIEESMCSLFGKAIRKALIRDGISSDNIIFRLGNQSPNPADRKDVVYVDMGFVHMNSAKQGQGQGPIVASPRTNTENLNELAMDTGKYLFSQHFIYRKPPNPDEIISSTFVEVTVANPFPCPLSRQRSLFTTEFGSNT